ncbi:MAG: hypothetical protein PHF51_01355 [Candidatus ainarchaeum sp.]|nr:hypothetical protein [Candidatus ainarchaeum sp.]
MDEKDLFALFALALLALALSLSTADQEFLLTQQSFSNALAIESAVKGVPAPAGPENVSWPYVSAAAFAYSQAASYAGAPPQFDPGLLVSVLKALNAAFALASAAAFYFALRQFYSREASAFGSAMAVASIPALGIFLSGIAVPSSLGLAAFACAAALLSKGLKESAKGTAQGIAFGALAGLAAAFSVAAWSGAILAFMAAGAGALAQAAYSSFRKEGGSLLPCALAFVALGAAGAALAGFGALPAADFSAPAASFLLFAPLAAVALVLALLKASGRHQAEFPDVFALAFAASSLAASVFSPAAALPGLAVMAAFAVEGLPSALGGRIQATLATGLVAGFAAFVFLSGFVSAEVSGVVGALLALAGGIAASTHGGPKAKEMIGFAFAGMLAFASITSALLLAQSQSSPVAPELAAALSWMAANTPQDSVVAVAAQPEMVAFISQRKALVEGVPEWLLSNQSSAALAALGADYLVMDYSYFDGIERMKNQTNSASVRIDSFYPVMRFSSGDYAGYWEFYSQGSGTIALLPIELSGQARIPDAALITPDGAQRTVPFARFLLLKDSDGLIARAILPTSGYSVNLFNAFFASVPGLAKAYPAGEGVSRVYSVGAG